MAISIKSAVPPVLPCDDVGNCSCLQETQPALLWTQTWALIIFGRRRKMSAAGFGIGSIKKPGCAGGHLSSQQAPHARRSFVPLFHIQFTRYSNGENESAPYSPTVAVHAISDVCNSCVTDGLTFSLRYESRLSSFCKFCTLSVSEADMKLLHATSSIQWL